MYFINRQLIVLVYLVLEIHSLPLSYILFIWFIFQANGIIKKLQGEVRGLVGKIKLKNSVTVSQEKVLQDTSDKLQNVEKDLQNTQQQLITKEEEVCLQRDSKHIAFLILYNVQ